MKWNISDWAILKSIGVYHDLSQLLWGIAQLVFQQ